MLPTLTPLPTSTNTVEVIVTSTATWTPFPSATAIPTVTPTLLPEVFGFGQSVEGRNLVAYRLGGGSKVIFLVGGIHTGFESNTAVLIEQMRAYYEENLGAILPSVSLIFVPTLKVDGPEYGRQLRGRFNANNVDLNRNWGCGWSEAAVFRNGSVDPGSQPFSEPETTALGSLIQRVRPEAVIFYHSAANGVFAGNCDADSEVSTPLADVYGQASGYPYGTEFSAYQVTGTAPAWADSIGIPAIDVELASAEATERNRNIDALQAVQVWVETKPPNCEVRVLTANC